MVSGDRDGVAGTQRAGHAAQRGRGGPPTRGGGVSRKRSWVAEATAEDGRDREGSDSPGKAAGSGSGWHRSSACAAGGGPQAVRGQQRLGGAGPGAQAADRCCCSPEIGRGGVPRRRYRCHFLWTGDTVALVSGHEGSWTEPVLCPLSPSPSPPAATRKGKWQLLSSLPDRRVTQGAGGDKSFQMALQMTGPVLLQSLKVK